MRAMRGDFWKPSGTFRGIFFDGYRWRRGRCLLCLRYLGLVEGKPRSPNDRMMRFFLAGGEYDVPCLGKEAHNSILERNRR